MDGDIKVWKQIRRGVFMSIVRVPPDATSVAEDPTKTVQLREMQTVKALVSSASDLQTATFRQRLQASHGIFEVQAAGPAAVFQN